MLDTLIEWDRDLFIFLNNLGVEKYDAFWIFITQIESWIPFFILLIVLLFLYFKFKKGALALLATLVVFGITFGLTHFTKGYVQRLRPNNDALLTDIIRAIQTPSDFSFFSGHASSSFAIVTFVVLLLRKRIKGIYLAYLWPLLFITSRIYVGVHYPSDILIGALVGTVIAVISHRFVWKKLNTDY